MARGTRSCRRKRYIAPCRVTKYTSALKISVVTIVMYSTPSTTKRNVSEGLLMNNERIIVIMYTSHEITVQTIAM